MTLTDALVVYDTAAAIALFILVIVTGRQEKAAWNWRDQIVALARRFAYTCIAITLAYRVWDIIDTGRQVSFIGVMTNMVMVTAVLLIAFTRLAVGRNRIDY